MTIRRRRQDLLVRFPKRQAVRVGVREGETFRRLYRDVALETRSLNSFARLVALQQLVTSYEGLQASTSFDRLSADLRRRLKRLTDDQHPKVQALVQRVLARIPVGEKVVIFTRFKASQRSLVRILDRPGARALGLLSHSAKKKSEILRRFRAEPDARFLICGEGAGEGLNLQFCSVMVNLDLPWNPMRLEQRIGRIQRLGQRRRKVTVVNMVLADSVEDRVLEVITEKLRIFEQVIGETEQILGKLFEKDSNKDFERWMAEVLTAEGGVDLRKLREREAAIVRATRDTKAALCSGGDRFDRVFGESSTLDVANGPAPTEAPIDLSFLEDEDD